MKYILIIVFLKSIFHIYFREKMAQAYDFALDKIGMEIMSYQVELKFSNTYTINLKLLRKIPTFSFIS